MTRTVIALGLVTALLGGACRGAGQDALGEVAQAPAAPLVVRRGVLEDRFVLTGELEARSADDLMAPRTPSWILNVRFLVEDGAAVKKGDRLVEFDSSALAGRVQEKKAALQRVERELASEDAKSRTMLTDKEMDLERKRAELTKAQIAAAVPSDLLPQRTYQERQLALQQRKDALAQAEEELAVQTRGVQLERSAKEVARTRAARELGELTTRIQELTLRAPRDGIAQIGENPMEGRKYLVGDRCFPGRAVVSLPDLGAMRARARLSDVDDGAVREGMRAECVLDAHPGTRQAGVVEKVGRVARTEGHDDSRRFFDVAVGLDGQPAVAMRPGMSMRIEVIRRRVDDVWLVPRAAVPSVRGDVTLRARDGGGGTVHVELCTEIECAVRGSLREGQELLPALAATVRGAP